MLLVAVVCAGLLLALAGCIGYTGVKTGSNPFDESAQRGGLQTFLWFVVCVLVLSASAVLVVPFLGGGAHE